MAHDMLEATLIEVVGGSPDVRRWSITAAIRGVTLTPRAVSFAATIPNWPHVRPPGWGGSVQYTLWIAVRGSDGQWRATGSIEFYGGEQPRLDTGSPLSSGLADWWYYAPEIGQPQPGETVGLFIAAGDQRRKDVRSVEERSNIVTFTVPAGDMGAWQFADTEPLPMPDHDPGPVPEPVPAPGKDPRPNVPLMIAALSAKIDDNEARAEAFRQETRSLLHSAGPLFAKLLNLFGI